MWNIFDIIIYISILKVTNTNEIGEDFTIKDYRDKEMKSLMYILFFLFLIWCTPVYEHIKATEDQSNYGVLVNQPASS
jgi:hypothetical protein